MTPPTSSSYFPVKILILEGPDKDKIKMAYANSDLPAGITFRILQTTLPKAPSSGKFIPDELEQWGNDVDKRRLFCKELFAGFSPEQILKLFWLMETEGKDSIFDSLSEECQNLYPERF